MTSFGTRDLALLLPDQVGDAFSLRHLHDDKEITDYQPIKPKIDPSKKVIRYFPGQAPVWIKEDRSDEDLKFNNNNVSNSVDVVNTAVDSRLARLARLNVVNVKADGSNQADGVSGDNNIPVRRRRVEAQVIVDVDDSENLTSQVCDNVPTVNFSDDNDVRNDDDVQDSEDDDVKIRRNRVFSKLHDKSDQNELIADAQEESDESEYETDTDESSDEDGGQQLLKPVFVPKHLRQTIQDKEV